MEGLVGYSLKSLKEKTHQLAVKSKAEEGWQPQTATLIVPSGEGRMVILEAPPTAKFEVGRGGGGVLAADEHTMFEAVKERVYSRLVTAPRALCTAHACSCTFAMLPAFAVQEPS
jgi:hypothetical protein